MKIVIIGAGYVGLTAATCLSEIGHRVTCVEADGERLRRLRAGDVPIYEPELAPMMARAMLAGRLAFSGDIAAVAAAEVVLLAVGTPSAADGDVDVGQLLAAAEAAAPHLAPGTVVAVKSTAAVGTARRLAAMIARLRPGAGITVGSNPEFLREGSAVRDFLAPDRIVIGADDERTAQRLRAIYAVLARRGAPVLVTSTIDAELSKYAANALLALKIGFINDVAQLCESVGGDVTEIAAAIGLDARIGPAFLRPGPGFGGSCFPKDIRAFVAAGRRFGAEQGLVERLIERNERHKRRTADRLIAAAGLGEGSRVAVLGLAFKAETDDMREAPALTIVPMLQAAGISVVVHDPKAASKAEPLLPGAVWAEDAYDAARGADAVLVLTEWQDYARLDWRRMAALMAGDTVVDARNLLDPDVLLASGLAIVSIGRPARSPAARPARAEDGGLMLAAAGA